VGTIFDGTGYGSDGTVWGGEILYGDLAEFQRAGTLLPVRLPGGAQAIRQPWRMACAWLGAAGDGMPDLPEQLVGRVDPVAWRQVAQLAQTGLRSPITSSIGRLFDAVAALCGLRATVNYEGQAAIELEAACGPNEHGAYPIALNTTGGEEHLLVIDPREAIRALVADIRRGTTVGVMAARFHAAVGLVTVDACTRAAASHGAEVVVLSGGVFQNRRLIESVSAGLHEAGLRVLVPERLPANDGGISYGQAAVAARRMGCV